MSTKSKMTTERGLGENILTTMENLIQRQTGVKTCVKCWHSKKDNSWNVNIYKSTGVKDTFFHHGKGWDIVDAVEKLRVNYLTWASDNLGLETSAKSTFEIEQALDARDGTERNDVGAVENDLTTHNELLSEISDLKQKFEDILTAVKTLKK